MAECIERTNLIARIRYYLEHTPVNCGEHYAYSVALKEVLNCPAADVAPVVHGRWIHSRYDDCSEQFELVKCSLCNHEAYAMAFYVRGGNYCPACGAKMDGGADNG